MPTIGVVIPAAFSFKSTATKKATPATRWARSLSRSATEGAVVCDWALAPKESFLEGRRALLDSVGTNAVP
eukprot:CAMPEP_0197709674 /NCGR_PEP_ID=MMETSP1338-20131121/128574_1 /TAXON_ID=43686 ORGANISM="Pelagodinium beii, Strain RCC1491" /NCGR_SAMPLE_ID=MMETSP1338 /ASSEMBLY_ACC=CAM_ASM_000754 /LENGTH=70 /DNA_ID=CAMNT_0043293609 /DNA_START=665 /DNA_END=873 /DNA_ORIENTATION=-